VAQSYPPDVATQASSILEAWKQIDPALKFGTLDVAALKADIDQGKALQTEIDALDARYTALRNQRDALLGDTWDKVKRVRASVKGLYGDDSSEYEMVGGTRKSERKPPTRKAKPVTA
jgi:hypothetical protein